MKQCLPSPRPCLCCITAPMVAGLFLFGVVQLAVHGMYKNTNINQLSQSITTEHDCQFLKLSVSAGDSDDRGRISPAFLPLAIIVSLCFGCIGLSPLVAKINSAEKLINDLLPAHVAAAMLSNQGVDSAANKMPGRQPAGEKVLSRESSSWHSTPRQSLMGSLRVRQGIARRHSRLARPHLVIWSFIVLPFNHLCRSV